MIDGNRRTVDIPVPGMPCLFEIVSFDLTRSGLRTVVDGHGCEGVIVGYRARVSFGKNARNKKRPKQTWNSPFAKAEAWQWIQDLRSEEQLAVAEDRIRWSDEYQMTVREAAKLHLAELEDQGAIRDIKGRTHVINDWIVPALGRMPLATITRQVAKKFLLDCKRKGCKKRRKVGGETVMVNMELARGTVAHIKSAASGIWEFALDRGKVQNNPWLGQNLMPFFPADDDEEERTPSLATDEEFAAGISLLIREGNLALAVFLIWCRCIGGGRTSDVHAAKWAHVDTTTFAWAITPRPKTRRSTKKKPPVKLVLDPEVGQFLKAWFEASGCPSTDKPVFPATKARSAKTGRKKGDHKADHVGYAKQWRAALKRAGITRHELHHDTPTSKRTTVHGLRHAYCTGLAANGATIQEAMALAGHTQASTAMRYVHLAERMQMTAPPGAVPRLGLRVPGAPPEALPVPEAAE